MSLHFHRPVHATWSSSQNLLSVLTSSPNGEQLSGIHWKKDSLSSHGSVQDAGKLLNEPITANTHFPDWIQRKPTFLESTILPLSQHSFRSSIYSLLAPEVVQLSINKEGVRLIPETDTTWKDPLALNQAVVFTALARTTVWVQILLKLLFN